MDSFEIFQKVLRYLFYVLVTVALVCYAAERWFDAPNAYWLYSGLGAIGCSLIRLVMRFV